MVRIRKMRWAAHLACLLMVCFCLGPAAPASAATSQYGAIKQKIIVFPFAVSSGVSQADIGLQIPTALAEFAQGNGAFEVVAFSKRHPAVQRAVLVEHSLTLKQIEGSYGAADKENALAVAKEMRGDLILVGDIESYKHDAAKNQSETLVSAELLDVRNGKVVKNMTIAGRTPDNSKAASETEAAALATGDAVTKIAEEIGVKVAPEVVETPTAPKKSKKKNSLLMSIVLGLGLGLAFGGGSGGGSGSTPGLDHPPDPAF